MGRENPMEVVAYAGERLDLEEIKGRLHMDRRGDGGVVEGLYFNKGLGNKNRKDRGYLTPWQVLTLF